MTIFISEAQGIADRMARKAVMKAVTLKEFEPAPKSSSSFEVYKSIDGRDILATATYAASSVEIVWTIGGEQATFDQAVEAIAARMKSRFG